MTEPRPPTASAAATCSASSGPARPAPPSARRRARASRSPRRARPRRGRAGAAASVYPFFGAHQAGIVTPAQDRLHFAAFDVSVDPRPRRAHRAAHRVDGCRGAPHPGPRGRRGRGRRRLRLRAAGRHRRGARPARERPHDHLRLRSGTLHRRRRAPTASASPSRRPAALEPLPRFQGDALQPERSGGDLCIQACADDPQVAVHAIRNLSRIAFGRASLRWSQLGFGRTSSTSTAQATPRNLFGFKDGTANVKAEETTVVDEQVWVQAADEPAWLAGGSYLVARRIRMIIENWDRVQLGEQEMLVGRSKGEGAPLSGGTEFTEPDFEATGADRRAAHRHERARAPRAPLVERRGADAAPGLQLRRRQRRARPPRRRALLPVVPALARAVHRRAAASLAGRRAQRVPEARRLGDLRGARRRRRRASSWGRRCSRRGRGGQRVAHSERGSSSATSQRSPPSGRSTPRTRSPSCTACHAIGARRSPARLRLPLNVGDS